MPIGDWLMPGASVVGAVLSRSSARDANRMNRELMREQMAFQERMSSTAHQREVADLRAAGLNPILSANRGASSPAGAMATMQNVDAATPGALSSAAGAAMQKKRLNTELKLMDQQVIATAAQAARDAAHYKLYQAEHARTESQNLGVQIDNVLKALAVPGAEVEARIDESRYGEIMRYIQRALGAGRLAASAVGGAALWSRLRRLRPGQGVLRNTETLRMSPSGEVTGISHSRRY